MYLSHFQLNLEPFQLNTDKRFFYLSTRHEKALANFRYGIQDNQGIMVLTGDVGTGKTVFIHALVDALGPDIHTAIINDPNLNGVDFLNFMAHAFGMGAENKSKGEFLFNFSNFLDDLSKANQQALLIVDGAQYTDPVQLDEIRVLSNLERGNNRLNVLLVGQDQFAFMIANNRLRALKQRITTQYHIEPLTLKETRRYVQFRLKVAGCQQPLFTPAALEEIFKLTNGYPRLISIVCDHCLLTAFEKGLAQVDSATVKDDAADMMHPRLAIPSKADTRPVTAPTTPPGVAIPKTEQVDPPQSPKPFASLLLTFIRKPAYLLAVAVILAVLAWFNFRDDPNPTVPSDQSAPPMEAPPTVRPEGIAIQEKTTLPSAASTSVAAPGDSKPDQAKQADRLDVPSPPASKIDSPTSALDEQPHELPVPQHPATSFAEPTADELELRDTAKDPRAIIDFLIRKRSQQPSDQ